jgi:cubilin
MNCTWFIKGPVPEDHVTLTFTHLDLQTEGTQDCVRDFVEVLDGEDLDAPSIGKYCFSRIPPAITSQGNGLVVRVQTNDAWGFGFRATYDISSGGNCKKVTENVNLTSGLWVFSMNRAPGHHFILVSSFFVHLF